MEKHKHSIPKLWVPQRNTYNLQNMECVNFQITRKVWENTSNSQIPLNLTDLELMITCIIPIILEVSIPLTWIYSVESHVTPRLWIFEEIRSY